ncbi:MAG TPA: hypothetical protein VNN17_04925 [Terriglobia bacterium]|nr:hypothetical protein [Terriglobia bacterium]
MARYRNLLLLAAVLFAQLLGMAYQLRRQQDVPLIRNAVVYVVAPVQAGLRTLVRAAQNA